MVCLVGWVYNHASKTLTPLLEIISHVGSECFSETFWHLTFSILRDQSSSPHICPNGRESWLLRHLQCLEWQKCSEELRHSFSKSEKEGKRSRVRKRSNRGANSQQNNFPPMQQTDSLRLSTPKGKSCSFRPAYWFTGQCLITFLHLFIAFFSNYFNRNIFFFSFKFPRQIRVRQNQGV